MKAHTNRLRAFAQLALAVSTRITPPHARKFAPRTYTQPQLLAAVLQEPLLRYHSLASSSNTLSEASS